MDWDNWRLKPANIYSSEITPVSKETQAEMCLRGWGTRLSPAPK